MKPEQVKARNEQLKNLYAERQAQHVQSNRARQETADQALADNEASRRIALATRQLESAQIEVYKIVHGASSGNQFDVENQYRRPTPRTNTRGQHSRKNHQPANLNTIDSFRFAGESEDRPMPPPRDTHVQSSVVDLGRLIAPVNRQSYSCASTTTTSLTGRPRISRPALVASMATQRTLTVERQNIRKVMSVAGASAVPILESWGLPKPDTVINDGINSWIQQVIGAYTTGNPAVLADSCLSMFRNV